MGLTTMRVYEYIMECDECGYMEILHTGDECNGVRVHTEATAMMAAGYHKHSGKLLCPICREKMEGKEAWAKEGEDE